MAKDLHYSSLQEEVDGLNRAIESLRSRNQENATEIKDINHEFEIEKELLLENLRVFEHETDFLGKILEYVMPNAELEKIRANSLFDENNHFWKVPKFYLENNQTSQPMLMKLPEIKNPQTEAPLSTKKLKALRRKESAGNERMFPSLTGVGRPQKSPNTLIP